MSVPPWVRNATEPTPDEIGGLVDPIEPELLRAVRHATAPSSAEIARLRPRPQVLAARRGVSPLWLAAPVAAVLMLLTARWAVPTTLEGAHEHGGVTLLVVQPGEELMVLEGVAVRGEGSAEVDGRTVTLHGQLRIDVREPTSLVVDGRTLEVERAEVLLDEHTLTVLSGSVRDGDRALSPGESWSSPLALVTPTIPPEPQPIATVTLRDPAPAPPPAPAPAPAPAPVAPAPAPALVPVPVPESEPEPSTEPLAVAIAEPAPVAVPEPEATAPEPEPEPEPAQPTVEPAPGRAALDDWRAVLAQLERDPGDQRRVALLDGYRATWPDSPFALEAEAMSLLAATRIRPPAQAVSELERWLGAHPNGPRALDLHASAAYLWRESLGDCGRAAPHDAAVAASATGARQATAEALLGLCALSSGSESGRARLRTVDTDLLDPALRRAVEEALSP